MREEIKRRAEKNLEVTINLSGISYNIHLAGAKKMGKREKDLLREREIISEKDISVLLTIYEKWRNRKG